MMMPMAERLTLTAQEAAVVLGVSESMVYKMARLGEIATTRAGRRVLVLRDPLLAKLQATA